MYFVSDKIFSLCVDIFISIHFFTLVLLCLVNTQTAFAKNIKHFPVLFTQKFQAMSKFHNLIMLLFFCGTTNGCGFSNRRTLGSSSFTSLVNDVCNSIFVLLLVPVFNHVWLQLWNWNIKTAFQLSVLYWEQCLLLPWEDKIAYSLVWELSTRDGS